MSASLLHIFYQHEHFNARVPTRLYSVYLEYHHTSRIASIALRAPFRYVA